MSAPEREVWLAQLQAEAPELAGDLANLLSEHGRLEGSSFLDASPSAGPALAGHRIGAYRLVRPIGQGGMGSVWLARRDDGRFEGTAAVKLLNLALIGHESERRFAREGQILARLNHSGIARLLDAGVLPIGVPYLVLEYIEGQRVDEACDARALGVPARVEVFREILAAVAHAHGQLIVHRDLKPSNVLIDEQSRVKLLDFGIAKLLEADLAGDPTALTREGGRVLTPAYAAPEQLLGHTITTATDVYALGVLLFLLLAGHHPSGAGEGPPHALMRSVLEDEAPRLVDAFSNLNSPRQVELARRRGTTPDKLKRLLHGDIDVIVARALRKNPLERYPSIAALDDDLRRYLTHRPIAARRAQWWYRTAKLARRNPIAVALGALAGLSLALGLVGVSVQARRATRQAELAEAQRVRADEEATKALMQRDFALRQLSLSEAVNDLNHFLLSDAAPNGKPFTVGDLLARAERIVARQYGGAGLELENRVELMVGIGRSYAVQDDIESARRVLERAYRESRAVTGHATRAKVACALANAISVAGEMERAERLLAEADTELTDEPQLTHARHFCLRMGRRIAHERGAFDVALQRVEAARKLLDEAGYSSPLQRLRTFMDLGEGYRATGRYAEADAAFRTASEQLRAFEREDTETASTLLNNWALVVLALGRPRQAEQFLRRAIDIESAQSGVESISPMLLLNMARPLLELGTLEEAARHAERALGLARQKGHDVVVLQALLLLTAIHRERGELHRATAALAQAEQQARQTVPSGHVAFAALASERSLLAAEQGERALAETAADEAIAIVEAARQPGEMLPRFLLRRVTSRLGVGDLARAEADARRSLELELAIAPPGARSVKLGRAYLALAHVLHRRGDIDNARSLARLAKEHFTATLGAEHVQSRSAASLEAVLDASDAREPLEYPAASVFRP